MMHGLLRQALDGQRGVFNFPNFLDEQVRAWTFQRRRRRTDMGSNLSSTANSTGLEMTIRRNMKMKLLNS